MNHANPLIFDIIKAVTIQSPVIFACLAGCIFVIVRWRDLHRAALPAVIGSGLGLLFSLVFPALWTVLPRMLDHGMAVEKMSRIYAIFAIVHSFGWAAVLTLFLLAVFMGRSPEPARFP